MPLSTWLILANFLLATVFTVLKAIEIRKWTRTQSQLVAEIQSHGKRKRPETIELMKTRAVLGKFSWTEVTLVAGFAFTGVVAVWNSIAPFWD